MTPAMTKKDKKVDAKENDRDGGDDWDIVTVLSEDEDTQENIRRNFVHLAEEVLELFPIYRRMGVHLNAKDIDAIGLDLLSIFYKIDKIAADISIPIYKPENYYEDDTVYCVQEAKRIYTLVFNSMNESMSVSSGLGTAFDITPLLPQAIFDCTGTQPDRKYGEYFKKYARGTKVNRANLE
eukprot:CAMPEP_0176424392 /NCGR_PEP_ID=MMETSP0127-20121128/10813_1 /TAXON_ID=938130 /ORGANISM="Platyophrya macrostoma, Strain WH" /LENGTH=180 /DNA_ID=CAMNT_0017805447 /DNA_START=86 /DNA_END=628 /DNA_ORIENTATION=+